MEQYSETNFYQDLANAIIVAAAEDYREALNYLKNNVRTKEMVSKACLTRDPELVRECMEYTKYEKQAKDVEEFFGSKWFSVLTQADPDYILREIRKEYEQ